MNNKVTAIANANSRSYFPELTGMRAVAAYLVYLHHFNPLTTNVLGKFTRMFIDELHIGVSIFFVLSGFLISFRYMDNFDYSRSGILTYFKRRFARIYPMYFIVTVLTYLYLLKHFPSQYISLEGFGILFANLTLIRGFFGNLIYSLVGQGWSLTVEECFYFVAPLLFFFRHKIKFFAYPIIFISMGCLLVVIGRFITFQGFFENFQFMFLLTFFGRCAEFIIGIYLAIVIKKNMLNKNLENAGKPGYLFTLAGIIGIAGCITCYVFFKTSFSNYTIGVFKNMNFNDGVLYPAGLFINNIIQPIFIAILFYGLINENTIFKKVLGSNLFILLGKSSYVFYLIHTGIVTAAFELIIKHIYVGSSIIYFICHYIIMFVFMNLLSILIFKTVEEKMNKYINNLNFKGK